VKNRQDYNTLGLRAKVDTVWKSLGYDATHTLVCDGIEFGMLSNVRYAPINFLNELDA